MKNILEEAFTSSQFRKEGHKLIDQLADYLDLQISGRDEKTFPWIEPEKLYTHWQNIFRDPNSDFTKIIEETLSHSIHLHNPRNIGHQVSAPTPHIILTELVAALLNNSTALYEMAMSGAVFERIVIEWSVKKFGYPESAGGILTSGGSLGALTALLAARQKMADFDVWEDGMSREEGFVMFVSEEGHYSLARAGKILGFVNNIIKVAANKKCQMDLNSLKENYNSALKIKKRPIAVIASACTTSTGSYDDINGIADFCESNNLWLHVDGAHGAGVVLSDKYKHLVKGISRADSIVVDFHKMLLCPSLVTAVLFKRNDDSFEAFKQKASYLWNSQDEKEWYNGGKRTIECTRRMMGLKIFTALKLFKEELFSQFMESRYDAAQEFAALIRKQTDFELALEPQSNIVCFRYCPADLSRSKYSEVNDAVRNSILQKGKFYIVKTMVRDELYLRTTIMNPFTDINHFEELLEEIRDTYKTIST